MSGLVYYNEFDPKAAAWLRELIRRGLIADGVVDERSICDVRASELRQYRQCHFFAGIGGWSRALRLAGIGDDEPLWTGSCPCQPFSSSGKRKGESDERHLWPVWFKLIRECRPACIYGEQVASSSVIGLAGKRQRISTEISTQSPRAGFDETCPREGTQAGTVVRPGHASGGTTGEDRCWDMRDQRPPVQPGRGAHMGQPIVRPTGTVEGLHILQYSGCDSRSKQRDGGLGRGADAGDRAFNHAEALGRLQCAFAQVGREFEGAADWTWFDGVSSDLEGASYSCWAVDLPAAGVGAPTIRQRLFWVAYAQSKGRQGMEPERTEGLCERTRIGGDRSVRRLASRDGERLEKRPECDSSAVKPEQPAQRWADAMRCGGAGLIVPRGSGFVVPFERMGDAYGSRFQKRQESEGRNTMGHERPPFKQANPVGGFWDRFDLCLCTGGKARRIEPGSFPLASGIPARVGLLRGYGNAINVEVAAEFIRASREAAVL